MTAKSKTPAKPKAKAKAKASGRIGGPQLLTVEDKGDGVIIVGDKKIVKGIVVLNMAGRGGPLLVTGMDGKQAVEIYVSNYIFSRKV